MIVDDWFFELGMCINFCDFQKVAVISNTTFSASYGTRLAAV